MAGLLTRGARTIRRDSSLTSRPNFAEIRRRARERLQGKEPGARVCVSGYWFVRGPNGGIRPLSKGNGK